MAPTRRSKKTQSIELRVSPELKSALTKMSAARGESMSETIRSLVGQELARPADVSNLIGAHIMTRLTQSPLARASLLGASVVALALVYSLATQSPAVASAAREARITFAELDKDADGMITPAEFAAKIAAEREVEQPELPVAPAACAGTFIEEELAIEAEEMAMPVQTVAEERVAELDSDGDAAITFDELEAYLVAERARDFLDIDEDGNGYVTVDEVALMMAPPNRAEEAAFLADEGLSDACIDAVLGEFKEDGFTEDPSVVLAEFDIDRDGRVGLMEFLEH
ncbi:MAG: EF-hand domain-containing protein [Pseudomonadota bacterium]